MTPLGQGRFFFDTNAAWYFMGTELADVLPIGSYHIFGHF